MHVALCVASYGAADPTYRALLPLARACRERGHDVRILAGEWHGDAPSDAELVTMPWHARIRGLSDLRTSYLRWLGGALRRSPCDCSVGWALPGMDVECEDAGEGPTALLAPDFARGAKSAARQALGLPATAVVLAMAGGDLVARGFERVLFAIAAMPADARERLRLVAAGRLPARFRKAVRVLGLTDRVHVCDTSFPAVLASADMLVDLPYRQSTNAAVVEAMALGRIVLTTENVAESAFVREAEAGVVLPLPYVQATCNRALLGSVQATIDDAPCVHVWRRRGSAFARRADHEGPMDGLLRSIESHLRLAG